MGKPIAVLRRDIIASTGPSVFGIKRNDKVVSSSGEKMIFLGISEGIVYLEREDKTKGEPFVEMETSDFSKWKKI